MSSTVDVNVLLYGAHIADPRRDRAVGLLEHLRAGPDLVTFFWPVLLGFVRIVTNPRVLARPLPYHSARSAVERLIAPAHVRVVGEADRFWSVFRQVADPLPVRGNLVTDAHLVALMRQHGVREIWTHDRDFRKFDGIVVRDPFV